MAKKKIQLQDANGNVLHPLTLGECVTMDNGENLDTLMSKSQMFTPTITQDKSMFKVGTGVDVDYSVNVKDGAYESLVFKGKTLKSLIDFKGKFQRTTGTLVKSTQGAITFTTSGTGKFNLGCKLQLKPNTKYLLRAKTTSAYDVNMFVLDVDKNAYIMGHTAIPSATEIAVTFTTTDSITDNINFSFSRQITQGNETITGQAMIVECDDSMEMNDIPLFEGLCDSKMPLLHNVGKNLLNPDTFIPLDQGEEYVRYEDGYVVANFKNANTHFFYKVDLTKLPKGDYSIITRHEGERSYLGVQHTFKDGTRTWGKSKFNNDGTYAELGLYMQSTSSDPSLKVKAKIMLVNDNVNIIPHEDYKTNILRTSEEIILRSLPNGVRDTYNPLTGEYVKRVEEIVLNGNESWVANSAGDKQFDDVWVFHNQESLCSGTIRLCDKLQARVGANENAEFIRGGGTYVFIYISKNKVQNHSVIDFKTWLQSNPITVQYELAEPVTTIVKPSTMTPFAYQNGHVIVESGFEGQSLLPEVEYSVVAGRTGQVTQNTKVLRKQEQQITSLEELLLTQVVQMEYERTLLQFDYELQMMMLG